MRLGLRTILGTLQLLTGTTVNKITTDGTLSENSDNNLVTEKAIVTYVGSAASSDAVIKNQDNIMLNAFRIATNGALTQQNMIDGIVDEYEDETGIDTASSTNETYDAAGDYYEPNRSSAGIDANTVLMLKGKDNVPDGSKAIVDEGNTGHIVSRFADATLSTAKAKFGSTSALFDDTGDALTIPSHSDFNFADGSSWTIDFQVYLNSSTSTWEAIAHRGLPNTPYTGWVINFNSSGFLGMSTSTDGSAGIRMSETISTGIWHHIAIVHDNTGDTLKIYVDGVAKATAVASTSITWGTVAQPVYIGSQQNFTDRTLDGYIDEFRTSSTARWTSGFTAPTIPHTSDANTTLLLHMDTLDVSDSEHIVEFTGTTNLDTGVTKFYDSSYIFDGSGDYIEFANNTDWDFGTNDWTIDFWLYYQTQTNVAPAIIQGVNSSPGQGWKIGFNNGDKTKVEVVWDAAGKLAASTSLVAGNWYHIAVERYGNTATLFINGSVEDTDDCTGDSIDTDGTGIQIGKNVVGVSNYYMVGSIDELRISKGISRYQGTAFTPETVPYETTSNIFNMTLISNSNSAEAQADSARIILLEEDVDTPTLNTDIKAYVSRDGGTSWSQVTLADEGNYDATKRVLAGTVDISSQGAGTSMEYKVETLNNKDLKLHAASLNWD